MGVGVTEVRDYEVRDSPVTPHSPAMPRIHRRPKEATRLSHSVGLMSGGHGLIREGPKHHCPPALG